MPEDRINEVLQVLEDIHFTTVKYRLNTIRIQIDRVDQLSISPGTSDWVEFVSDIDSLLQETNFGLVGPRSLQAFVDRGLELFEEDEEGGRAINVFRTDLDIVYSSKRMRQSAMGPSGRRLVHAVVQLPGQSLNYFGDDSILRWDSVRQSIFTYGTDGVLMPIPRSAKGIDLLREYDWEFATSGSGQRVIRLQSVSETNDFKLMSVPESGCPLPLSFLSNRGPAGLVHCAAFTTAPVSETGDALWFRKVYYVNRSSQQAVVVVHELTDISFRVTEGDYGFVVREGTTIMDARTAIIKPYESPTTWPSLVRRYCDVASGSPK